MAEYVVAALILEWEHLQSVVLAEHVSWSVVASASGLILWFSSMQQQRSGMVPALFCSSGLNYQVGIMALSAS